MTVYLPGIAGLFSLLESIKIEGTYVYVCSMKALRNECSQ